MSRKLFLGFVVVMLSVAAAPGSALAQTLPSINAEVPVSPECSNCLSSATGSVTLKYSWTYSGGSVTTVGSAPSNAVVTSVYLAGTPTGSNVIIDKINLSHGGWTDIIFQAYSDGTVYYPTATLPKQAPFRGQLVHNGQWVATPSVLSATSGANLQMNLVIAWHVPDSGGPRVVKLLGVGGNCLDADWNPNWLNGTKVQLWDCTGAAHQQWTLYGDGTIRGGGGKCLDADWNANWLNGTKVQLWDCTGVAHQQWTLRGDGTIRGPGGKCLDADYNASWLNGTKVQLWDCTGVAHQQWQAVP